VVLIASGWYSRIEPVFVRLVVSNSILFGVYSLVLLFVMKQKPVYTALLREIGVWPLGKRRQH